MHSRNATEPTTQTDARIDAYAPRARLAIRMRYLRHLALRAPQLALFGNFDNWPRPHTLVTWPQISTATDLNALIERIKWYLKGTNVGILLWVTSELEQATGIELPANTVLSSAPPLVAAKSWLLILRMGCLGYLRFVRHMRRAIILDPWYYAETESSYWAAMQGALVSDNEQRMSQESSTRNWHALWDSLAGRASAVCYLTGPSVETAGELSVPENSVRIICNSLVKNEALLDVVKPQILTFADPVFHFGPSMYAQTFREHARAAIERYRCWVIVPHGQTALMLRHYPELKDRLIGFRFVNSSTWRAPSRATPEAHGRASNVLTGLMLPIARALAKSTILIGSDGRKDGEKYFWTHSRINQFSDLMQSAFDAHPSFFRDRDYGKFYQMYCEHLSAQVESMERDGIPVKTWTPSFIPCLEERYEKPPVRHSS